MVDSTPDDGLGRWTSPDVLLVATDLSDLGRLMPFALEQAAETDAHLILLHAVTNTAVMSADAAGLPYYDPAGALQAAVQALEPWCKLAYNHSLSCDAVVREGQPAHQIVGAIRQFRPARVLLGTRSRSKLGKLLVGSVAEHILRSVNLPVITVGPRAHLPAQPQIADADPQRVVLYATTLKETSRSSAALACGLAAAQRAKLVLLHVLPPTDEMERKGLPTGLDSTALHELRTLAALTAAGCCTEIEPHVVHGNPSIEILAEASENRASLIVLGATHRSAFENLTRDRVIYSVLAHARCPVLTLREPLVTPAADPSHDRQAATHP
jgi:nucleotide-binding universal stress UspA family protein